MVTRTDKTDLDHIGIFAVRLAACAHNQGNFSLIYYLAVGPDDFNKFAVLKFSLQYYFFFSALNWC